MEYSPGHSQSVCPRDARNDSGAGFPLQPKNAAQNRLYGPETSSNFADLLSRTPLPWATVGSSIYETE